MRPKIYAIIETGGKQYKVTEGQMIDVELLKADIGGTVELDRVLLIGEGENVTTGNPIVEGARVTATVSKIGRAKKVIVFKYKSKTRYRRKNGHRQSFTTLSIDKILGPGADAPKAVKKTATRRKKKEETADGA